MIEFWKFVMIAVMLLFFPSAIVVALKGFGDVLKMFADLDSANREEEDRNDESS